MSDFITAIDSVASSRYRDYYYLVPEQGPMLVDGFEAYITVGENRRKLVEGVDFAFCLEYIAATRELGKVVYGGLTLHNLELNGIIEYKFKRPDIVPLLDKNYILTTMVEMAYNPRTTSLDMVTNIPDFLPPLPHQQDIDTIFGQKHLIEAVNAIAEAIGNTSIYVRNSIQELVDFVGGVDMGAFLEKAGGDVTGPIRILYVPTDREDAVPKYYVDDNYVNKNELINDLDTVYKKEEIDTILTTYLKLSGGDMTGMLALHADPTKDKHAATKRYVDALQHNIEVQLAGIRQGLMGLNSNLANLAENTYTKEEVDNRIGEILTRISSIRVS